MIAADVYIKLYDLSCTFNNSSEKKALTAGVRFAEKT
jgi:hypothetical protein